MSGRKSLAKGRVVEEEHVARTNELTSFGSASNAGLSGSRRESQGLRVACKRHGTLGSGSDAPLQRSTPGGITTPRACADETLREARGGVNRQGREKRRRRNDAGVEARDEEPSSMRPGLAVRSPGREWRCDNQRGPRVDVRHLRDDGARLGCHHRISRDSMCEFGAGRRR